jgi:hypothetical protein
VGAINMVKNTYPSSADIYHIRVRGILDEKWTDWFDGLAMTPQENGETLLSGKLIDQAELFGILTKINNLGLTLLLLERKEK